MEDLLLTSSQFRGLFRAQVCEKIDKKTDQIFQKRAFGLRRPHNFAIPLAFFLSNKCQKWTFRLRRPHNFADQHGRRIDRYVSKTDVWLETSSQFRFPICQNMINSLYFFCGKRAFGLRRPHNFAFSPAFFLFF